MLVVALLLGALTTDGAHAARDVSGTCPPVSGDPFPDVRASDVHAPGIACVLHHHITVGRADGTYGPSLSVTRGQMATFLRRLLAAAGSPVPAVSPFDPNDPHRANLADLVAARVILVMPSAAGAAMTRAEMVDWMTGAYYWAWKVEPWGADLRGAYPFADVPASAPYREDALQLFDAGVVAGTTVGQLNPTSPVTRGQMASFLARLLDAITDGPNVPTFSALSAQAQALLQESAQIATFPAKRSATGTQHGLFRWAAPLRFWADSTYPPAAVREAVQLWNQLLGSVGPGLEVVTSRDVANVVFVMLPARPADAPGCGGEGPRETDDGTITTGYGEYWLFTPECRGVDYAHDQWVTSIFHGLGHVLGFVTHTPAGSDRMGSPESAHSSSALLEEIMRYIYSVPPGWNPS